MKLRSSVLMVLLFLVLALGVSACSGDSDEKELTLAPASALPDFVRDAPAQVTEAYRFAIANPDIVSQFPCFCGCGGMGHMSNLDCYIQEFRADGSIVFGDHAYG